jgi:eukaryotic-like serine/threonine-protein kinase
MAFQTNQKICNGRYTIIGREGEGRFGITYRAKNLEHQLVIIKTLNDVSIQGLDFERLQDALVREAWKLAKCRSPYIVKAEEPFQEGRIWCIPMEFIPGESLEDYVLSKINNRLSDEEALEYINHIIQALEEVHKHNLLHLDVRPANILLRIHNQKEAVLIDFGLARRLNDFITQTRSREIIHGFAPPELYSSSVKLDARTDIYALGATLYFVLTGEVPLTVRQRTLDGLELEFPPLFRPDMKQAILWAMKLKMEDRPNSVKEWQKYGLGIEDRYIKRTLAEVVSNEPSNASGSNSPIKNQFWQSIVPVITALGVLLTGLGGVAALIQVTKPASTPTPSQTINTP